MQFFIQTVRAGLAIAAAATLAACGDHGHESDDHGGEEGDHVHVAPHADEGGILVELGDHFANAEFLLDAETGTMTMYTYDGHAESTQRSPSESVVINVDTHGDSTIDVTLVAQASELSGEKVGDSSKFIGQSDDLKGLAHFHGTIKALSLKGKDFTNVQFDFDHEDDDGGEEHGDGDEDEAHAEDHDGDEGHDDDGEHKEG